MLYISRHVYSDSGGSDRYSPVHGYETKHRFGVADTEDGVEEIVTRDDLEYLVRQVGLDISGVYTIGDLKVISGAFPYQNPYTASVLQTKLHVMYNIDVSVHNNQITSILWDEVYGADSLSLRLSDFAPFCGDMLLYGNDVRSRFEMTLVFDDKLESMSEYSFRLDCGLRESMWLDRHTKRGMNIVFDIREVTREDLAFQLYKQVSLYRGCPLETILDNEERKTRMLDWYDTVCYT